MSRSLLGLLLFFILGIFFQSLNPVFGAWFVQVFVFFSIPWISCRLERQAPARALGFLAISPKKLVWGGLLGLFCYFAVVLPLMHWAFHWAPASWKKMFDGRALFSGLEGMEWLLMVGVVTLAAPLCEEVFFRGFVQPRFIRRWGVPMGLLVSSVLFSFIHVDPLGFLARVVLGMLFGWLAYASASLWVPIVAHASYNFLVYMLFAYSGSDASSAALPLSQGVLFLWLAFGIGGMVALLWGLFPPPLAPKEPKVPYRLSQTQPVLWWSALRPWLLAAGGSCLLLVAIDYRGVALNVFDTVIAPLPRAARESPQLTGEMERMRALRQEARKGQVELKKYFEFRQQFSQQLPAGAFTST